MELKLIKNGKETPLVAMFNSTLQTIGGSLAAIIPYKIVKKLELNASDTCYVYTNNEGQIVIDLKPRG